MIIALLSFLTHLLYNHCTFRPSPGEIRQIYLEKSSEQLGITIEEGSGGAGSKKGVFVSSVSENSLASQVGLQVFFSFLTLAQ